MLNRLTIYVGTQICSSLLEDGNISMLSTRFSPITHVSLDSCLSFLHVAHLESSELETLL
jgi:hypothetical protein